MGIYGDERGFVYRQKYKKWFFGIVGFVYIGIVYDQIYYFKKVWEVVGDFWKFKEVCDWIWVNLQCGVCGYVDMGNLYQEVCYFLDNGGDELQVSKFEVGVVQFYVQIQGGEYKIVYFGLVLEMKLIFVLWWS